MISSERFSFFLNRLRDRLWVKPLAVCVLSILAAIVARLTDYTALARLVPVIAQDTVETLLSIMASSMLGIAVFSVASMVSAYASASSTATPRSFPLVVADDVSQNALSIFVGAFVFSIVALFAVTNDYFETAGRFVIFVLTVIVFAAVVVIFIRWTDRIARLGRMGPTIDKVEATAARALKRRRDAPTLHGVPLRSPWRGRPVFAASVGYVQHIDMAALQAWAEEAQVRLQVAALPGTFATPERPLAYVSTRPDEQTELDCEAVAKAFQIGDDRLFDDDPRFGLVVLSEIADRALSPAINDPGTAIDVIGTLVVLFVLWSTPAEARDEDAPHYDRVEVPELSVRDMFDDAFTPIGRDGAGMVEVMVRLQKGLGTLAALGNAQIREAAEHHGRVALKRAQNALNVAEDVAAVQDAAKWAEPATQNQNK